MFLQPLLRWSYVCEEVFAAMEVEVKLVIGSIWQCVGGFGFELWVRRSCFRRQGQKVRFRSNT